MQMYVYKLELPNALSHTHLQFATATTQPKNYKRVCLCQRYQQNEKSTKTQQLI